MESDLLPVFLLALWDKTNISPRLGFSVAKVIWSESNCRAISSMPLCHEFDLISFKTSNPVRNSRQLFQGGARITAEWVEVECVYWVRYQIENKQARDDLECYGAGRRGFLHADE